LEEKKREREKKVVELKRKIATDDGFLETGFKSRKRWIHFDGVIKFLP